MDGQALDQGVEHPGGLRVEVPLQRRTAAGHPGVGDLPQIGVARCQGIQLVGEQDAPPLAQQVAGDQPDDGLPRP